ncbi:high-potential iron-sulfur protein [Sphingomonas tabacisoli]|uniref:High-potential iron-sulfur protein n=1 Tax=Sphingomonas tabacisoli TaxID=2249466 RepID=A0ABW4I7I7_9SPHN
MAKDIGISRRGLLCVAATGAAAIALASRASAANAEACFNPDALPAAQKSLRRSLGFQLASPDPARKCGGCAFFTAKPEGCGSCALLSGGPVTAASVCNSWAKRG